MFQLSRYAARGVAMIRESSRSIGDGAVPNVQIVQPLRSVQAVRLDSSWFNVQWFNGRRTRRDWAGTSTLRIPEASKNKTGLEVQLATLKPDVDP